MQSATINSVNTVYAQLIDQLGADEVVETAERMGMRCCLRVSEPRTPLLPYLSAVLGTNEVEYARDGERIRDARDRRAARRTRCP